MGENAGKDSERKRGDEKNKKQNSLGGLE